MSNVSEFREWLTTASNPALQDAHRFLSGEINLRQTRLLLVEGEIERRRKAVAEKAQGKLDLDLGKLDLGLTRGSR